MSAVCTVSISYVRNVRTVAISYVCHFVPDVRTIALSYVRNVCTVVISYVRHSVLDVCTAAISYVQDVCTVVISHVQTVCAVAISASEQCERLVGSKFKPFK